MIILEASQKCHPKESVCLSVSEQGFPFGVLGVGRE
jgi:hypothetical protein